MSHPNGLPAAPAKHRDDIDGLRAVAVLAVVLFHLGLPIHGGYVGVDVFFTISGYLIGSIILTETGSGSFSLAHFYERRIRRIFPALFVMLVVVSAAACRFLLPQELERFAASLAAAITSLSNFWFWSQSGYFDNAASSAPLLHTWSLAVEEQFYIFCPLIVIAVRRRAPARTGAVIWALLLVSFAVSAYGAFHDRTATFYAPYTRAWELLLGTALALEGCPAIVRQWLRHVAGLTGLAMIVVACFLFNDRTPFPGFAALLPCVGAALVIAAGARGGHLAGRFLSIKPMVFVGLVSYSLYLWHWPVNVFDSYGLTLVKGVTRHQNQLLKFSLSLALAALSWRFVEVPFRSAAWRPSRRPLFAGFAVASTLALIGGAAMAFSKGLPERFPPAAQAVAGWIDNDPVDPRDQYRNGTCFITSPGKTLSPTCLAERPGLPTLLILGDSHAAAMWWGFDQILGHSNVMQATASGCKPVLKQRPRQYAHCVDVVNYVLNDYLSRHTVDAVLIEARWDEGDLASLGETMTELKRRHIPVVLVGPNVQYDSPLPRLLAHSIAWGEPLLPRSHLLADLKPLDSQMAQLAREQWHVPYVSLFDLTCSASACEQYAAPGVPLLSDYGHFTKQGSVRVARQIIATGVLANLQRP